AGEPWLDRVAIARCNIDWMTGNLSAHVAGDDGKRRFVWRTSGRNQSLQASGGDDRRCDRPCECRPGRALRKSPREREMAGLHVAASSRCADASAQRFWRTLARRLRMDRLAQSLEPLIFLCQGRVAGKNPVYFDYPRRVEFAVERGMQHEE